MKRTILGMALGFALALALGFVTQTITVSSSSSDADLVGLRADWPETGDPKFTATYGHKEGGARTGNKTRIKWTGDGSTGTFTLKGHFPDAGKTQTCSTARAVVITAMNTVKTQLENMGGNCMDAP